MITKRVLIASLTFVFREIGFETTSFDIAMPSVATKGLFYYFKKQEGILLRFSSYF